MSVKTYPKGERFQLSEHFTSQDFDCHCDQPIGCDWTYIDEDLITSLESLCKYMGGVLFVTSGFRCVFQNQACGGKPGSFHLTGMAADVKMAARTGQQIGLAAISVQGFRNGGIGVAPEWAHLDVRGRPARWAYPKA